MPASGDLARSNTGDPAAPPAASSPGPRRTVEIRGSTRRGGHSRFGPAPLNEIGIAGLSRSRVAWFVGLLMVAWVVAGFIGQAGDTVRATDRAAVVKADNAALEAEVAALRAEVGLVGDPRWIAQRARSFGYGTEREIPFVLGPGASPLPADAPGSAARRLGTRVTTRSALEGWLDILFGPGE